MRSQPTCLPPPCGVSALHPQRILAQWMVMICPGRIVAVANAPTRLPSIPIPSALPPEVRRVVHAVSVQMMRWGADLCFHHAARLLAHCIPGLQLPLGLFNAVRCLGAAARHDLLQSLEAAVCAALAQPETSPYVRAMLGETATAALRSMTARSDVVIGLAICALLLERLQPDQPTWPQTRAGQAVAGGVAVLRIVSNANGVATQRNERALASVPERAPSLEQYLVSSVFPRAGALLQPADDLHDDPAAAGWGVNAGGRTRTRHRLAKPMGGGTAGQRGKSKPGKQQRRLMAAGAGVHARRMRGNQRDTFSPPDGTGPGFSGSTKLKDRKKARAQPDEPEAPAEHRQGAIVRSPASARVADASETETVTASGPRDTAAVLAERACLRFDNLARTRHQIRQLPLLEQGEDVLFCVHRKALRLFQDLFATASTEDGDIVALRLMPEPDCAGEGVDERLRMYSGLQQLRRGEPRGLTSLGNYRLLRVATISVISDRVRQDHHLADERLLASNQFAVMRTRQCDGSEPLHLSFFMRRSAPHAAMNFGFSEIERRDDHLVIREDGLLLESNSAGLGNLIPRIEDLSGLRQAGRGTAAGAPAGHRPVQVLESNHLFVRLESLPAIPVDRAARLQQAQAAGGSPAMYRMSFRLSADGLSYVDRTGRRGVLHLGAGSRGNRRLTALPGAEAEFLQQHGLHGRTIEEGVQILENYGFSRLPVAGESVSDRPFPLNGFRIRADDAAADQAAGAQPAWDGRSGTFALHADGLQVDYVEADGRHGVMEFVTVRYHPDGCVALDGNEVPARLFARRAGLVESLDYTWHDIRKALHAHGLVER